MRSLNLNKVVKNNGSTADIVQAVTEVYQKDWQITQDFAKQFSSPDPAISCKLIFDYVIKNIRYEVDPPGVQWVKTPARLVSDGVGDCKSMAIFTASCLRSLGIPHVLRFAAYGGSQYYTHVYVIAYINGLPVVIDPVVRVSGNPKFNYEEKYSKIQDMEGTKIVYMAGLGSLETDYNSFWTPNRQLSADEMDKYILMDLILSEAEFAKKQNDPVAYNNLLDRADALWLYLNFTNKCLSGDKTFKDMARITKICNSIGIDGRFEYLRMLYSNSSTEYGYSYGNNSSAYSYGNDSYAYGNNSSAYGYGNNSTSYQSAESINQLIKEHASFNRNITLIHNGLEGLFSLRYKTATDKDLAAVSGLFDWIYDNIIKPVGTGVSNAFKWVGKTAAQFGTWVTKSIFVTQDMKNKAIGDLKNNCEYFAYCFIDDQYISSYPAAVQDKRAKQMKVLDTYNLSGIIKNDLALGIVEAAIKAKYNQTLAQFFESLKKREVAAIQKDLSAVQGIDDNPNKDNNKVGFPITVIITIITFIIGLFGKKKEIPTNSEITTGTPTQSDFPATYSANTAGLSGGGLISYLPYIALGAVAIPLLMSKKK